MLTHNIDEKYSICCRKIIFYSVAELEAKFEVKKVMGMHCEILAYVIEGANYRKSYIDEFASLGEAICLIEHSPKGIKVCTIDLKYQISLNVIKEVVQIRLDDFDYSLGHISFVEVGQLDHNDQVQLDHNDQVEH